MWMIEEHLLWCIDCVGREEEILHCVREKGRDHVDHISTDELGLYHSGDMTDTLAIARIEQHVSECQVCADRTLAIERFISLVRAGVIRNGFDIG